MFCVCVSSSARRIAIKIFKYDGNTRQRRQPELVSDKTDSKGAQVDRVNTTAPTAAGSLLVAELQLATGSPRHRRRVTPSTSSSWQSLLLPTTFVQEALDSPTQLLRVRIVCDGCEAAGKHLVIASDGGDTGSTAIAEASSRRHLSSASIDPVPESSTPEPDRRLQRRHRHHRGVRHWSSEERGGRSGREAGPETVTGNKMEAGDRKHTARRSRGKRNKVQTSIAPYLVVQVKRRPAGWRCLPSSDQLQTPICRRVDL